MKKEMIEQVTIKRRVLKDNQYVEITQKAEMIKDGKYRSVVRLENGDFIKRKNKDIICQTK